MLEVYKLSGFDMVKKSSEDAVGKIEERILESFAAVAETIGYSPLHGKIIAVLLIRNAPTSLNDVALETGYSSSMISLSFDFLEIMEVITKIKKPGDRKLYVKLNGDLLGILKKAIVIRVKKALSSSLEEFGESKESLCEINDEDKIRLEQAINTMEHEIGRLSYYVAMLDKIELP